MHLSSDRSLDSYILPDPGDLIAVSSYNRLTLGIAIWHDDLENSLKYATLNQVLGFFKRPVWILHSNGSRHPRSFGDTYDQVLRGESKRTLQEHINDPLVDPTDKKDLLGIVNYPSTVSPARGRVTKIPDSYLPQDVLEGVNRYRQHFKLGR